MTVTKPKHRRPRGSGSVYLQEKIWWISYRGPDGKRKSESTESSRKSDAEKLLETRNGSRIHNLPVIRHAEKLTFDDAAQMVINDFTTNNKASIAVVQRRLTLHLRPYFTGRRMAGITPADVIAFVAHRQEQGIIRKGKRVGDVSNAEINRELQTLKRCFSIAIDAGLIATKPKINFSAREN